MASLASVFKMLLMNVAEARASCNRIRDMATTWNVPQATARFESACISLQVYYVDSKSIGTRVCALSARRGSEAWPSHSQDERDGRRSPCDRLLCGVSELMPGLVVGCNESPGTH
eukprot:5661606-Amphidinium_carterae.1